MPTTPAHPAQRVATGPIILDEVLKTQGMLQDVPSQLTTLIQEIRAQQTQLSALGAELAALRRQLAGETVHHER